MEVLIIILILLAVFVYFIKNKKQNLKNTKTKEFSDYKYLDKNIQKTFKDLEFLKNYNFLTFDDILKNLNNFYKLTNYIKSDYNLITRYFNSLLIYQDYIFVLVDSFYLNIPQEPEIKKSINSFNQKIQKQMDKEIRNLLLNYKKNVKNNTDDNINIFTSLITDTKPRPYNML